MHHMSLLKFFSSKLGLEMELFRTRDLVTVYNHTKFAKHDWS